MKILNDERAETPWEVGGYTLLVLLVMAFLMTVVGAFLDAFGAQMATLQITMPLHNSTMITMMSTYLGYINWTYRVPIIFIIIVLIWGVRAVIRKHTYTTGTSGQQIMNPDEDF